MSTISHGLDIPPEPIRPVPAESRGGPQRSVVCDHAGARARCAGRVPQQHRLAVERRSRRQHRPVAADGVAADAHAGAARLSQARRQGTLPARARHPGCGLSRAVAAESPATGAALDARLRGLHRRHGIHRDAVRPRLHLCRDAAHHRCRAAYARRRLYRHDGDHRGRPRAAVAVHRRTSATAT